MKLRAHSAKHTLKFTFSAGTSRGVLNQHQAYFIYTQGENSAEVGIGECSPLKGLSPDYQPDFEPTLTKILEELEKLTVPADEMEIEDILCEYVPENYPALRFGLETSLRDLIYGGQKRIFPSVFQPDSFSPIPINGLVWMGDPDFMKQQIDQKLSQGFDCIKLKIGAIDFAKELALLEYIRKNYSAEEITIRVDANGAFTPDNALPKLHQLAKYNLHSIEQPIAAGQTQQMHDLCRETPLPIALDEELIGIYGHQKQKQLLLNIRPQYIILKPTLLGGLSTTQKWIEIAEGLDIGWWMTSALESNIGLNAIAQFAAFNKVTSPQGLGTGQLYYNNIPSPLQISKGSLEHNPSIQWDLSVIENV